MLAAVLYGPRDIRVEEVSLPEVGSRDVLIRVEYCGICATDLHMYEWEFPVKTPVILGHEFSGTVVEVGSDVENLKKGDKVAVMPIIYCGNCPQCKAGRTNLCENAVAIGGAGNVVFNGAFAEYVKVPARNAIRVPRHIPLEDAALTEPLACCIHGIDRAKIKLGDTVFIVGAGPIGLILLQLARLAGASNIIVSDLIDKRLQIAEKLGADVTINAREENVLDKIRELTYGRGVDIVIEAVGSVETVEVALKVVREGGRVNIFGVPPRDKAAVFIPFNIYFHEIEVTGTYAFTAETFLRSIKLIASRKINTSILITDKLKLDEIERGLLMMKEKIGLKKLVKP